MFRINFPQKISPFYQKQIKMSNKNTSYAFKHICCNYIISWDYHPSNCYIIRINELIRILRIGLSDIIIYSHNLNSFAVFLPAGRHGAYYL